MKYVNKMYTSKFVYETEFSKSVMLACEYMDLFERNPYNIMVSNLSAKYFGYAISIAYMAYLNGAITSSEYDAIDTSISHSILKLSDIHDNMHK